MNCFCDIYFSDGFNNEQLLINNLINKLSIKIMNIGKLVNYDYFQYYELGNNIEDLYVQYHLSNYEKLFNKCAKLKSLKLDNVAGNIIFNDKMINLQKLEINCINNYNIKGIEKLINLTEITINSKYEIINFPIQNIDKLTKLKKIYMNKNIISDDDFATLLNIKCLSGKIVCFNPIFLKLNLKSLSIWNCSQCDINLINNFTNLEELNIMYFNPLTSQKYHLNQLNKLKKLQIVGKINEKYNTPLIIQCTNMPNLKELNCKDYIEFNCSLDNVEKLTLTNGANISKLQINYNNIKYIKLRYCEIKFEDLIKLKNIETIILISSNMKYEIKIQNKDYLINICDYFKNIRKIEWDRYIQNEINISKFNNLKKLSIESETQITNDSFDNLTNLEYLKISAKYDINPYLKKLKKLKSLILSPYLNINKNTLISIPSLEQLICHNFPINNDTFKDMPNLTKLDLKNNNEAKLTNNAFKNLSKLQYLNIEGCKNIIIRDNVFDYLKSLKFLDISKCKCISEYGINKLENIIKIRAYHTRYIDWKNVKYSYKSRHNVYCFEPRK